MTPYALFALLMVGNALWWLGLVAVVVGIVAGLIAGGWPLLWAGLAIALAGQVARFVATYTLGADEIQMLRATGRSIADQRRVERDRM